MEKTVLIAATIILGATLPLVSTSAGGGLRRMDRSYYNCTAPGFVCKSCNQVVLCDHDHNGNLVPYEGDKCEGKHTCLGGKCTEAYNKDCHPTLATFVFKCQQQGIFPDPFDCTKYHLCYEVGEVSKGMTCPSGLGFEPRTLMCTFKITTSRQCSRPVDPCQNLGQGPISGNNRLYYMCNKDVLLDPTSTLYFPSVIQCAAGLIYFDGKCNDPSNHQNVVNGKCTATGSFFRSGFCDSYNECVINMTAVAMQCPSNQYFNRSTMRCTTMSCTEYWSIS